MSDGPINIGFIERNVRWIQKENAELRQQLTASQAEVKTLSRLCMERMDTIDGLRANLTTQQSICTEQAETIDGLNEQLKQSFPTNWEAERKSHRLIVRDLEKQVCDLKSELTRAHERHDAIAKAHKDIQELVEQNQAEWQNKVDSMSKQIEAYTAFIKSVSSLAGIGESVLKLDFRKLTPEELAATRPEALKGTP